MLKLMGFFFRLPQVMKINVMMMWKYLKTCLKFKLAKKKILKKVLFQMAVVVSIK